MTLTTIPSHLQTSLVQYQGPIERVTFQFAMRAEAHPLINHFGLHYYSAVDRLPHILFAKGRVGSIELHVVVHGEDSRFGVDRVGTETATLAAFKAIEIAQPSLLINAGTAGGFEKQGGEIGDVYISSGVVFHDHRIPLGAYKDYGVGKYPVADAPRITQRLHLKRGIVSTGNSLDASATDLASLTTHGAHIKEMEAAAIAQVAFDQNIPFFALKAVTDLVDQPCNVAEVFMSNLDKASQALSEKLIEIVHALDERPRLEAL